MRAALAAVLVTSPDVDLPGYTAMTPAGEDRPTTATAIRYFTAAGGFRQLSVTLVAAPDPAAARADAATAFRTAVDSLRSTTHSGAVAIGADGHRIAGRTKGYGALQDSIFFVEGSVSVAVTLSSSTPDQPPDLVTGVARAQDVKLRKAA
ncbi:hypothetical protein [uncultured Jatrophihabitans sp.]|uniref:hypothetical protein n=1 Tax=uncultured Jatrophihabitans sp. TaxID=1610747 RepID=UPI0035CADA80